MKLKPLADNVIVKTLKGEEMTKSGIVLPDSDKDKQSEGEVVAVGPGKTRENGSVATMSVKVGDRVMFRQYAGQEVKIEEEKYTVLSEGDIVAVIE
jgi:chaperonin GroES